MALRFTDLETGFEAAGWAGEWYFSQRSNFLHSTAFDTLARELRQYVNGTVSGRSFLIAAHRGIGKTSLVLRAVDELERDLIRSAVKTTSPNQGLAEDRGPSWQRPLLVKLHGSSLLAPPKEPDDPGKANVTFFRFGAKPPAPEQPSAEAALQQITITLYRALAREIAKSFTQHARDQIHRGAGGRAAPRDVLEVAAQLTLDLDLAPGLVGLRRAWDRLGRLEHGVLWPGVLATRLAIGGLRDLGLAEIVAVATANQAFRVCAGRVEASQTTRETAQREASVEARTRLDLKEAANKLWALIAGGLVGGAILGSEAGPTAAIAAGLATALVSTLALGWSATRNQRSESSDDYTFISDHTVQTLDRDLPVVIDRIRAAGLAPVFLIDELDKLEDPVGSIAVIINRLKNLTTDYGFFCFLTDRAYFEEIERKLREEAYPPEHTFFSHRMLVVYRPAELARYVHSLWSFDQPAAQGDARNAEAPWILTCMVLHRARLNLTDVRREIGRLCGPDGIVRPTVAEICTAPEYLVPMAMQLALEHVLRQPAIRRRMQNDNAFAQLAFEVLYVIAHAWDGGATKVDLDLEAVRSELIGRRRLDGDAAATRAELAKTVPEPDLVLLVRKTQELATLLCSFARIRERILAEEEFRILTPFGPLMADALPEAAEQDKIATLSLLLLTMPGLSIGVLAAGDTPSSFEVLFDRYGVEKVDDSPASLVEAVKLGIAFLDGLKAALDSRGFTLAQLAAAGVLPATLNPVLIEESLARLRPIEDPVVMGDMTGDVTLVRGLQSTVNGISRAMVKILALASLVHEDGRLSKLDLSTGQALAAIDSMLGIAGLRSAMLPGPSQLQPLKSPNSKAAKTVIDGPPLGDAKDEHWWTQQIDTERQRMRANGLNISAVLPGRLVDVASWRMRLWAWLASRTSTTVSYTDPGITYGDLVGAAAGILPAPLRPDLESVTVPEWSSFCMTMYRAEPAMPAPWDWAFPAGLRALGFGRKMLAAASGQEFADTAPEDRPFVVLIGDRTSMVGGPPDLGDNPVFALPRGEAAAYAKLVNWLSTHGELFATARQVSE